jgi:hypothetical protein
MVPLLTLTLRIVATDGSTNILHCSDLNKGKRRCWTVEGNPCKNGERCKYRFET